MRKAIITLILLLVFIFFQTQTEKEAWLFDVQTERSESEITQITTFCRKTTSSLLHENVLGISIAGITPIDDKRSIDSLVELGVNWVRVELPWSEIEQTKGNYNWEKYDTFFEALSKKNIRAQVSLNYIPRWVTSWEQAEVEYTTFVSAAVQRYKHAGVRHWKIFNEPNLMGYGWGFKKGKPELFIEEYALMLASANRAIRKHDANAIIILGGLSPEGYSWEKFTEKLLLHQAQSCFDIFAFHPYGSLGAFDAKANEIRNFIRGHGVYSVIWFNEFGTTDDKQRLAIAQRAFSERQSTNGFFWFSLQDLGTAKGKNFGLLRLDFTKKPEFDDFVPLYKTK